MNLDVTLINILDLKLNCFDNEVIVVVVGFVFVAVDTLIVVAFVVVAVVVVAFVVVAIDTLIVVAVVVDAFEIVNNASSVVIGLVELMLKECLVRLMLDDDTLSFVDFVMFLFHLMV